MTEPLSDSEIARLREQLEIEAIRKLRLDYTYWMDRRDVDKLTALFTEDALCEYGPYGSWSGRQVNCRWRTCRKGWYQDWRFSTSKVLRCIT